MNASIIARFGAAEGALELFAHHGAAAVELLQSNPVCGFCLATHNLFHEPPIPWQFVAARALMVRPQREIMGWLGFPQTEAAAKLGRKCVPESLTIKRCLRLRALMKDEQAMHALAHLPRINAGVIGLMSRRELRPNTTPKLLAEVSERPTEDKQEDCAMMIEDIRRMAKLLRRSSAIGQLHSWKRTVALHDELAKEMNQRGALGIRLRAFPPPALPGVDRNDLHVTPITSMGALQELGRAQRNCVASRANAILSKRICVYCVTRRGEVCTLAIGKTPRGSWAIQEFRGVCNRRVSQEICREVQTWLVETQTDTAVRKSESVQPRLGSARPNAEARLASLQLALAL